MMQDMTTEVQIGFIFIQVMVCLSLVYKILIQNCQRVEILRIIFSYGI